MDDTDYLIRRSEGTGKKGHPMENISKKTDTFDRGITSDEDNSAYLDDGVDSSDGEDEFDWVEVVAMSCEDPSADDNIRTRPQGKRKKLRNLIKEWRVNEDVQLAKSVEGNLFNATIQSINQDGTVVIRFKDTELMMSSKYGREPSETSPPSQESVENGKLSNDSHLDDIAEETVDDSTSSLPIQRALFNHLVSGNSSVMNDTSRSLDDKRVTAVDDKGADSDAPLEEPKNQAGVTVNGVLLLQNNILSYCPFCREPHKELSEHFREEHANSVQVKRWLKKKKRRTKEALLRKMQNMGNYRHNCKVIRAGKGKLILGQPIPEGSIPSEFTPCPECLGFFNRKWLLEHKCISIKVHNDVNSRITCISDSKLLLPLSQETTESVRSFVVQSAQEIEDIVSKDDLMCELSHRDFARFEFDEEKSAQTKRKISDLSKLLAHLNETNGADEGMQSIIDPDRSQQLMTDLKTLCDSNGIENENGEAFVRMIFHLRECSVVLRAKALEDGNWLLHENSLKFIDLCNYMLGTEDVGREQEGLTEGATADIVRAFTEDVILLWRYICEVCTIHRTLLEDAETVTSSSELRQIVFTFSKVVLTKVLLFNKEDEGCIAKMRLKDFCGRQPPKEVAVQDGSSLNWTEHLSNSLSRVSVKDEAGVKKTILLTEDMVECIELLISKRDVAYISPGNKEVFTLALFSCKGDPVTASDCVKEFCSSCGLVFQDLVTCLMLNKALAIAFQLTCISKENSEVLANYEDDQSMKYEEDMTLNQETFRILKLMKPFLGQELFMSPRTDSSEHVSSENMQEDKSQLEANSAPSSGKRRKTTSKRNLSESNPSCMDEEQENVGGITEEQEHKTSKKRKKNQSDSSQRVKKQKKTQKVKRPRKPTVLQTSVVNGVRLWDKKYYCLFCGLPTSKIPRHLQNNHACMPQVAEWMAETDRSKKLALLAKIRNMGNCKHNCQVLKEGVGRLIVVRRPSTTTDPGEFIPCPVCYGFYNRTNLWHHLCRPSVNNKGQEYKLRNQVVHDGRLLLPVSSASSQSVLTWLAFMKRDEVVECFVQDWLICEFAQKDLAGKSLLRTQLWLTKAKLKMLANLLLKLRELNGNKNAELQEFIDPSRFPEVEDAIRALTEYDAGTSRYLKPHMAEKMWQHIKKCSVLIRGTFLELGQFARLESAWSFGKLCDAEYLEAARQCPPKSLKTSDAQEGESKRQSDLVLEGNINIDDWNDSGQDLDIDAITRLVEGEEMDGLVTCDDEQIQSVLEDEQNAGMDFGEGIKSVKSKRSKQNKKKRQFYSEEEKEAVWRHLGNAIKLNQLPGKIEILKCKSQEPVLERRTWRNIKYFCHNVSKSRSKTLLKYKANSIVAGKGMGDSDSDQYEEPEEVETKMSDSEDVVEMKEKMQKDEDGDSSNTEDIAEIEERQQTDGEIKNKSDSEEVEEVGEKKMTDGEAENTSDFEEISKDNHVPDSTETVTKDKDTEGSMEEESRKYGLRKLRIRIKKNRRKEQLDEEDKDYNDRDADVEKDADDNVREEEGTADDNDDWEPEDKTETFYVGSSDEEYAPSHSSRKKGKKVKSKPRSYSERRSWSQEEKEAVYRHLEAFIVSNSLPTKKDIMKCKIQEAVLDQRTWRNIKDFCRNAALSRRRKAESEEESLPTVDISSPSSSVKMKLEKKRGPATPEEQEAIRKHFKLILRCGLLPSRKVIEKIMWKEKTFDGRSWWQVREFCIKEKKKLQSKRAQGILS